jgi:hypothetical protein
MKNLTINSSINFGGFYNSIHSDIIDTYIEDYEYDWEKVNYISTYENYSKDYIKVLNNILDTNISFKALNSPRFYNYSTDVISIEISKKDALKLFQYVRNEELKQEVFNIIKDSSTSKDGYVAFYNYKDFFKKDNLDILLECMLDVIIENLQDDIVENLQSNYLDIVFNEDN